VAVTLFAMRLELARARALEGLRVGDEDGPSGFRALAAAKVKRYAPHKMDVYHLITTAGKCLYQSDCNGFSSGYHLRLLIESVRQRDSLTPT
jgi:hypothetical protein